MPTTKDWMSLVPGGTPLRDVTLPGSHDAGVFGDDNPTNVRCQDRTIYEQLKAGSRFFDLRAYKQSQGGGLSTMKFGHFAEPLGLGRGRAIGGRGSWGGSVDDATREIARFLQKRNSEIVILRFSHMKTSSVTAVWNTIQGTMGNKVAVLAPGNDPNIARWPVGAYRGKVICCFDSGAPAPAAGRFSFSKFKANNPVDVGLVTCGSFADSPSLDKVRDKQMAHVATHQGHLNAGAANHFFVLYWTQTLSLMGALTGGDIKGMTDTGVQAHMNRLQPYATSPAKPSVVLHDFVNSSTCRAIIQAFNGISV